MKFGIGDIIITVDKTVGKVINLFCQSSVTYYVIYIPGSDFCVKSYSEEFILDYAKEIKINDITERNFVPKYKIGNIVSTVDGIIGKILHIVSKENVIYYVIKIGTDVVGYPENLIAKKRIIQVAFKYFEEIPENLSDAEVDEFLKNKYPDREYQWCDGDQDVFGDF